MTFRHLPPPYARRMRAIYALAYTSATWAGTAALFWTPRTIEGALGMWMTYSWALMAITGGLVGVWAMVRNTWRIERWGAPLAVGGAFGYVAGVWSLVITETMGRAAQAGWVTAALLLLAGRAIDVWAAAHRDRLEHDAKIARG